MKYPFKNTVLYGSFFLLLCIHNSISSKGLPVRGSEKAGDTAIARLPNITAEQTIEYLNKKLAPVCQIRDRRGDMVVAFFRSGTPVREDIVAFEQINPTTVKYSASENGVIIQCLQEERCIKRRMLQNSTHDYFSRILFPVECTPQQQQSLVKAFVHLIMLYHDPGYKSNVSFE